MPDVEGGIPAARTNRRLARSPTQVWMRHAVRTVFSAGLEARLYVRQGCLTLREPTVDSLNVTSATSVFLYEASRQRGLM